MQDPILTGCTSTKCILRDQCLRAQEPNPFNQMDFTTRKSKHKCGDDKCLWDTCQWFIDKLTGIVFQR